MLIIVGAIVAVLCTLGGYAAMGGHLYVLWQPFEVVIIVGTGIGAFIISNPKPVLVKVGGGVGTALKGSKVGKKEYLELLSLLYQVFRLAKTKGMLSLESHVENPRDSSLFQQFPGIYNNPKAMTFLCDYLRLMSLNAEDPHTMEALMDEEIESHEHESTAVSSAIQTLADGLPALGIVAAVLGVIKTMGSISEPPEVLGRLIGGALVGTFLGVWLSYAFVGPVASAMRQTYEADVRYYQCMKAGMLAHLHGYAPAVSVEFARKALFPHVRPDFYEVEETTSALPSV